MDETREGHSCPSRRSDWLHTHHAAILEAITEGVFAIGMDGRIEYANTAALRMLGYRAQELIGRDAHAALDDARLNAAAHATEACAICRCLQGQDLPPPGNENFRRSDGTPLAVRYRPSWLYGAAGEVTGGLITFRDASRNEHQGVPASISEQRLHLALEAGRLGTWHWMIAENAFEASAYARALLGTPADTRVSYASFLRCVHPEDRTRVHRAARCALSDRIGFEQEFRLRRPDGEKRWLAASGRGLYDEDGRALRLEGVVWDVTERRRVEQEMQRLAARLVTTLESITDTVFTLDHEWRFTYLNKEAERVLRKGRDALLGKCIWNEFPGIIGTQLEQAYRRAAELRRAVRVEFFYPPWNHWYDIHAYPSEDGLAIYLQDVTERKLAEDKIHFLALYDPLTHLPNRRLLADRLQQALHDTVREKKRGAVLFLDLDRFKNLNDTFGHHEGDRILREAARRLTDSLRAGDTVARFGGDEFVVVLSRLGGSWQEAATLARAIGQKLVDHLSLPYDSGDQRHHLSVSVGISLFGEAADIPEDLLKRADMAMYEAKQAGAAKLRLFDPDMQAQADTRARMEVDLRRAIDHGEIEPYYQPQVDPQGKVIGAEALARWYHRDGRLIPPDEFVPVAEQAGLILPIGRLMLEQVCTDLARWRDDTELGKLLIAVNVSALEFHEPGYVHHVLRILERSGARARQLQLEITESVLLKNLDNTLEKMRTLKTHGLSFSLDDFGTGFSSLAYLKRLPLDQIKIDRGFVQDVLVDRNDAAIVRSIIELAGRFGIQVIAEGVQTEQVRQFLVHHGCAVGQGFLFSEALPRERFERFVRDRSTQKPSGATPRYRSSPH